MCYIVSPSKNSVQVLPFSRLLRQAGNTVGIFYNPQPTGGGLAKSLDAKWHEILHKCFPLYLYSKKAGLVMKHFPFYSENQDLSLKHGGWGVPATLDTACLHIILSRRIVETGCL